MKPEIIPCPVFADNYSYLIVSGSDAAVVDPSAVESVLSIVKRRNLRLRYILSTHHHSDHTGGNKAVKAATGARVLGGDSRISSIDSVLGGGAKIQMGDGSIEVISVPGHTSCDVAYYLAEGGCIFTGDTLFGAGCGRIFEGSAEGMYHSLMALAAFPDDVLVYFGHEYTVENLEFALTVEPDNPRAGDRLRRVRKMVSEGGYSVPSTIAEEKLTNPFLRVDSKTIRLQLGMVGRSPVAVFAELRKRKDRF